MRSDPGDPEGPVSPGPGPGPQGETGPAGAAELGPWELEVDRFLGVLFPAGEGDAGTETGTETEAGTAGETET